MRADCADENKSKSQTADTGGKKITFVRVRHL